MTQNRPCNCWVSRQSPVTQFGLRYGAHSTACPKFRESKDPVDRLNDTEIRRVGEADNYPPVLKVKREMAYAPRFDRFREITARFDSETCVNGQHKIKAGDVIGYARQRRGKGVVCCAGCWAKWVAENVAADFDEMQYASQY